MRRLTRIIYVSMFLALVGSTVALMDSSVLAAPGGRNFTCGYFLNNCIPTPDGSGQLYGQVIVNGFGANPGAYTNKAAFISFMIGKLQSGGRDGVGAAFIINTMLGQSGPGTGSDFPTLNGNGTLTKWQAAINNPSVSISYETYGYQYNSGWQRAVMDDAYYDQGGITSHAALVFKVNGTPVYALKDNCANPIGNLPGLPSGTIGNINGIKVLPSGASAPAPAGTASIAISGPANSSGTSNPFFFNGIPTGNYTVTAANVAGYTVVGSTWCQGAACNPGLVGGSNYRPGNTTTVTVANGSTAQMRWIYQPGGGPPPPTACPGQPGVDITHVPASFPQGEPTTFNPDGSYTVRAVTAHHITSATDANTGAALSHDDTTVNFSTSAAAYPYDTNTANVTYVNEYDATTYDASGNVIAGPTHYSTSAPRSGSATLGECYWRKFTIQPAGQGGASFNNYENPSTATITDLINVTFGYDGPAPNVVRNPMKVNGINLGPNTLIVRRHNPNGTTTDLPYPYSSPLNAYPSSFTSSTTVSVNYRATIPSLQYGDEICFALTANPGSGDMDENGNIKPPIGGPNSDNGATEPICSPPLAAKPYLRVFGGDVDAGAGVGVGATCTATPVTNSGINTWNQGAPGYAGSGTQFGAEAYAIITGNTGSGPGFASALGNGNTPPYATTPKGLTFANTSGTFGGNFASAPNCADYTAGLTPNSPAGGGVNAQTFGLGAHTVIYSTSNVYISGNIIYTNSGWVDPSKIPSFKLIVSGGNIYIDSNVTELDGLYVAEPNGSGSGGNIYTCVSSTNPNSPMPSSQLFTDCGKQLVINGSFVAKQVFFQRTYGSDYQGSVNEVPTGSHAGEVFVYSPEMWLTEQPGPLSQQYDSITSLPPIL